MLHNFELKSKKDTYKSSSSKYYVKIFRVFPMNIAIATKLRRGRHHVLSAVGNFMVDGWHVTFNYGWLRLGYIADRYNYRIIEAVRYLLECARVH